MGGFGSVGAHKYNLFGGRNGASEGREGALPTLPLKIMVTAFSWVLRGEGGRVLKGMRGRDKGDALAEKVR